MVDTAGPEDADGDRGGEHQGERGGGGQAVGEAADDRHNAGREDREGEGRPEVHRQEFGRGPPDEGLGEQDQPGDRQVDEARPVHQDAGRRREPRLEEIEPALAGQELADLDEAHRRIGIVETAQARHPAAECHQHGRGDDRHEPGTQRRHRRVRGRSADRGGTMFRNH